MAGSWSQSQASQPSVGSSWRKQSERRYSPIPYRVGPLDYHPSVNCHYGMKAALWISWSDDNPGRRYLKCYHAREGGCSFSSWYEGPHDPFVQTLLVDLRNAVWTLKRQNAAMREELAINATKHEELKPEVAELMADSTAREGLKVKRDELKGTVKQLQRQMMFLSAAITVFGVIVLKMWLG
ncbi:hypothetical protein QOZ80_7BG0589630 [Eleusine coracana subsp. coracana]|nr:hypothetical protein QOZ80_7BG0589630 [Eleusine coracana subsp. coracana]